MGDRSAAGNEWLLSQAVAALKMSSQRPVLPEKPFWLLGGQCLPRSRCSAPCMELGES